jgi:hypothetical protein
MRENDSQRGDWLLELAGVDLPVSYLGPEIADSIEIEGGLNLWNSRRFLITDSCYWLKANRQ